jgi:hypothetical protein
VHIEQHVEPGKPFLLSDGTTYDPGERFQVNAQHQIPEDMVVQGDTVVLRAAGDGLDRATQARWRIVQGWGQPKLTVEAGDPRIARFTADGYGLSEIAFEAVVDGRRVTGKAQVFVEFSTGNMLLSKEEIPLPPDVDRNPLVEPVDQVLTDHREQVTARNPKTGRLVTLWQVKFGRGDACPMGVGVMTSDDHGLTWKGKRYLYLHGGDNSGWGSLCWNPGDGEGEFLLWTCSHVRSPGNRIMLFRSRDNAETWEHAGDYQVALALQFGKPNGLLTYFGVNRTIRTSQGALVAPMVCDQYARTIRSDDHGRSWQAGNLDATFPHGNEDALVETIDGRKLILMARPTQTDHNRRFESSDGGKTWTAREDTPLPTARVNFGLDKIVDPGTPDHGRVVYCAAATRSGPHAGRQRLVVAVNRDPVHVARDQWDVRLLWDASCNYSDVLYVPDDKSLLVTVETMHPGVTSYSYAAIRYFKMSLRYWRTLPSYAPSLAHDDEGYQPLFNGRDLDGWILRRANRKGYVVEDGLLVSPADGGGYLFTEKEYSDFSLRFEFRLSKGANNGVAVRTPLLDKRPAYEGIEIQILDNVGYPRKLRPAQYHGSIYDVVPAKRGALKPIGQWNRQEIICSGRRITVIVNDMVILDAHLDRLADPELLEKHPGLKRTKGHVGLLGHGSRVEFRNLRIKEQEQP